MTFDRSNSMIYRTFLAVAVSTIPFILFSSLENVVNCSDFTINDFGNSTFHKNNPKATFSDYMKSCNDTMNGQKPVIEFMKYVGPLLIGIPAWIFLYKEWLSNQKKERYDNTGKKL